MLINKDSLKNVKVLTTDPERRIGLFAIRYFGRAGAEVDGIADGNSSEEPIGFSSRYINKKIYTQHGERLEKFKNYLVGHSKYYDLVYPVDVSRMLSVIEADEEYGLECKYLLPKKDSLIVADNKELLIQHAQKMGLSCPRTLFRISEGELEKICRKEITYPCVIKFRGDQRETHWKPEERYSIVRSPEELLIEYRRMHGIEEFPIIQEYIKGGGYGYSALFDKSHRLRAQFCHKRLREYPISGGPSSCAESYYHEELVSLGRRLLESLDWTGIAMVEFKFDEARKRFFIIEVNPRLWGSLPLAIHSGVNFPVLHAMAALDMDFEDVLSYKLGVKVRFIDKDIKSIIGNILKEKGYLKKVELLLQIFNVKIKDGLIELDDIGPVLKSIGHKVFQYYTH